jgi:hypothetical protein
MDQSAGYFPDTALRIKFLIYVRCFRIVKVFVFLEGQSDLSLSEIDCFEIVRKLVVNFNGTSSG